MHDNPENLYCADHHFFHDSMRNWFKETRGFFDNIDQMHEAMIENHNARATNATDVWIIGDFAMSDDEAKVRKVFEKMKGRKHLIVGNHDNRAVLNQRWSSPPRFAHTVKDRGRKIFLCHYAIHSWPGFYNGHFHFFGHTHGRLPTHGRMMDVGVDAWNLVPATASEIIARMKEWNPDFDTYTPERKSVITCAEDNVPEDEPYAPEPRNQPGYGFQA